jgi:hypothetical protein
VPDPPPPAEINSTKQISSATSGHPTVWRTPPSAPPLAPLGSRTPRPTKRT